MLRFAISQWQNDCTADDVSQNGALTYLLAEPFRVALKMVERALAENELEVVDVLDLSEALNGMLGVHLHGCTVLCVSAGGAVRSVAAFVGIHPLRAVIAPSAHHTAIHVWGPLRQDGSSEDEMMAPLIATQSRILLALDSIAMRESSYAVV